MYLGKERLKEKTISLTLDEIEQVLTKTPLNKTEINTALIMIEEGNEAKEKDEFKNYLKFAEQRLDFLTEIYQIFKEVTEGEKENEETNS